MCISARSAKKQTSIRSRNDQNDGSAKPANRRNCIMNKYVARKQQGMAIFSLNEDHPRISETAFIAPNATVIGKVRLGDGVSVWPSAVIRGDKDFITIEDGSNVQDGAIEPDQCNGDARNVPVAT